MIVEFWGEMALFDEGGPVAKAAVTRWEQQGYSTSCKNLNSTQVGGVVDRYWLIIVHYRSTLLDPELDWPEVSEEVCRPMSNCLRPTGVPGRAYRHDLDSDKAKLAYQHAVAGSEREPMPAWPGSLISTPRGTRKLLNAELAQGLGTPKPWLGDVYPQSGTVRRTPAVHILEYVGLFLVKQEPARVRTVDPDHPLEETLSQINRLPFSWKPPDLGPSSDWTRQRVFNLIEAALHYENPGLLIERGLQALHHHRSNYDEDGPNPTHLQLFWWEFPPESWDWQGVSYELCSSTRGGDNPQLGVDA
jgi:hypothetical protein